MFIYILCTLGNFSRAGLSAKFVPRDLRRLFFSSLYLDKHWKIPFYIEYSDMAFAYGFCNANASSAAEEYRFRYSKRRQPDTRVFCRVFQQLHKKESSQLLVQQLNGSGQQMKVEALSRWQNRALG